MANGERTVEELLQQQLSLRNVIEQISTQLTLAPLLDLIVSSACRLLDADDGSIALVDESGRTLRIEATYNMPADELGSIVSKDQGLLGRVYSLQSPVVLKRYGDLDTRVRSDVDENSVIGVPITWHRKLLGVFGIGARPPKYLGNSAAEVLQLFAKHAAIAISNARLYEQTQRDLNEAQLIADTSRKLGSAMDLAGVVGAYLEQIAAHESFSCSVALYEFDLDGNRKSMILHGQFRNETGMWIGRREIPLSRDKLDPPLDRGETIAIPNVQLDKRVPKSLRDMQMDENRPALAIIPLIVRNRRIGVVALSYPEPLDWSKEVLRRYEITATHLAAAIDSRMQYEIAQIRGQREIVDEERKRIARELHDSVTQLIFSINLSAQALDGTVSKNPELAQSRAKKIAETSKRALEEMRALLGELRPIEPARLSDDFGDELVTKIKAHAAALLTQGTHIEYIVVRYEQQQQAVEHTLVRSAQEAITNAVKHAQCTRISVSIRMKKSSVELTVKDDGIGFDTSAVSKKTSGTNLGLIGILERCKHVDGTLSITSTPGKGTKVIIRIPRADI